MTAAVAYANRAEIMATFVDRLASGDLVATICADEGMPSKATIDRWTAEDADFEAQCARARARSAGVFEDRVIELATKCAAGELEAKAATAAGNLLTWVAMVRNRKVYAPKVDVEHSGEVKVVPVLNLMLIGELPEGHEPIEVQGVRVEGDGDGSGGTSAG